MDNTKLEDIRRKLQRRIDRFSNHIADTTYYNSFQANYKEETLLVRKEQSENKRLMAALIHLQRENKELHEECNLFAASVVRRFMGESGV